MGSPAADIFQRGGHAEIVERILSYVGWRDVLSASAVCVNLNNIVMASSRLQLVLRREYHALPAACADLPEGLTSGARLERMIDIQRRWATMDPKRVDLLEARDSYKVLATDGLLVTLNCATKAALRREFVAGNGIGNGAHGGGMGLGGGMGMAGMMLNHGGLVFGFNMFGTFGPGLGDHGGGVGSDAGSDSSHSWVTTDSDGTDTGSNANPLTGGNGGQEPGDGDGGQDNNDGPSSDSDHGANDLDNISNAAADDDDGEYSDGSDIDNNDEFPPRAGGWTVRDCTHLRDGDIASVPTFTIKTDYVFRDAAVCRADNMICTARIHRRESDPNVAEACLKFYVLAPSARLPADMFENGTPIIHPEAHSDTMHCKLDRITQEDYEDDEDGGDPIDVDVQLLPNGIVHLQVGRARWLGNWRTGERIVSYTDYLRQRFDFDGTSLPLTQSSTVSAGQQAFIAYDGEEDKRRLVVALVRDKAKDDEKRPEAQAGMPRPQRMLKDFFDVEPGTECRHLVFPFYSDPDDMSLWDPTYDVESDSEARLLAIAVNNSDGLKRSAFTAVILADRLEQRLARRKGLVNLADSMDIVDLAFYEHSHCTIATHALRALTVEHDDSLGPAAGRSSWSRYSLRMADYRFRDTSADLAHTHPVGDRTPHFPARRSGSTLNVARPDDITQNYLLPRQWDWSYEDGRPVETTLFMSREASTALAEKLKPKRHRMPTAASNNEGEAGPSHSTWKANMMGRPGTAVEFTFPRWLGEVHCAVLDAEHIYMCLGKRVFILSF